MHTPTPKSKQECEYCESKSGLVNLPATLYQAVPISACGAHAVPIWHTYFYSLRSAEIAASQMHVCTKHKQFKSPLKIKVHVSPSRQAGIANMLADDEDEKAHVAEAPESLKAKVKEIVRSVATPQAAFVQLDNLPVDKSHERGIAQGILSFCMGHVSCGTLK